MTRINAPPAPGLHAAGMSPISLDLDARGLEPPQPMVRILEALAILPPDGTLRARTDRRPVHLYPLLEQRGFRAETTEIAGEGFLSLIQRRD